ncbi:radical SAM/SPASM domain-containing protein [Enterococcus faecalis]|uniref:radical SAM/SPASM domain-containing protein n=1 Tax=Enterococcus faecalis TaxID=1351 RepID=UPI00032EA3EA|nr:radical SAM protein [Enterococcus faecalis]EOJ78333.1 radical SAM additional 4Fe4S-binding SPASM domain-containing protein [Enterococcus faecalis EnGen0355]VFA74577.1 radical SAM protein [Enterococcus faecalis]
MLKFYFYRNKVIVHNPIISSWIGIEENELPILEKYLKTRDRHDISKDLLRKIELYRIFDFTDLEVEENFHKLIENFSIPRTVYIVVTEECNLKCTYCYAEAGPGKKLRRELDYEEYDKIFKQLKVAGVKKIVFTGGEVGLKKNFYKILDNAYKKGFICNLISNGKVAYNIKQAKFLSERCYKITISLDSLNENNNDDNRGRGCFKVATKALENLIKLNFKNLAINQTITKNNIADIDTMVTFAKSHKINLNIGTFCKLGRGFDDISLTKDERKEIDRIAMKYKKALNPFTIKVHCGQGIGEFSIDPMGNVYTCKLLDQKDFYLGNVRAEPLDYIFKNKKIDHFSYSSLGMEPCKNCSFKLLCGGSCRANHYYSKSKDDSSNVINNEECKIIKGMILEQMYQFVYGGKEHA